MNRKSLLLSLTLALGSFGCGQQSAHEGPVDPELSKTSETALKNGANVSSCTIFNETACILNTSKSTRSVAVNYPGLSFCGMRFVSTSSSASGDNWNDFFANVEITYAGVKVTPALTAGAEAATLDLGKEARYLDYLVVRTLDGSSVDAVVKRTFPNKNLFNDEMIANHLLAVPVVCPEKP